MMKLNTLAFLLTLMLTTVAQANIHLEARQNHAKELMGKRYSKSVVANLEQQVDVETRVRMMLKENLPKKYKHRASQIGHAIITESNKHGLDPYFVLAVISGESSFNPDAVGTVGELGLMQVRASTGKWIAKMTKTKWEGKKTLRDPIQNVVLGTAYIAWLRGQFDNHGQLYVAAYNMGPSSVKKAVSKKIWPKDYPKHVMKRYLAFYQE